ncbi:MFS transporter [Cohnella zeiphila]|uniref:MFS transporter n=1 Tax=Cohnella zeiphila TaxID=2761120 RepID=A0A7X0SPA7_9BACL|nr:MFS transporter [Cohnella zeiphila]MBB6733579.1 MFS transporter [Cohnella zeiphila]
MKNGILYLLTAGAFVVGTAELVVAGILDRIAEDLNVTVGAAGQLIAAYSLAYAIGTPVIIAATSRLSRNALLIGSLALFALGCAVSVAADDYAIVVAGRVVLGVSSGIFSVIAFGAAAELVPPEKRGRAVGMVTLGMSAATVLGIPAGVLFANWGNWRTIFIWLCILTLLIMAGIRLWLPKLKGDAPVRFTEQFRVLRNPVIVSGFLLSGLFTTSASLMNSYQVPYLQDVLHSRESSVSALLLVFGLFGMIGSRLGGVATDKSGSKRIVVLGLAAIAAALILLPALSGSRPLGWATLAVWNGVMSLTIPAVLTYLIQQAPQSANIVLGFNTSMLHLGVALGASGGGALLQSAGTVRYHPWIAAAIALAGLVAAAASFAAGRRMRLRTARTGEAI